MKEKTNSQKMREYYNKFLASQDTRSKRIFVNYMYNLRNKMKKPFSSFNIPEDVIKRYK